jgi:hypothetical protein
MSKIGIFLAGSAVFTLAACGGEQADQTPPTIKFFEGGSASAFFGSDGTRSGKACKGGLATAYSGFQGASHARSGGGSVSLRVTFSDPAGIKRAYLQIPGGRLASPEVSKTVPVPTPGGGISNAYEYNFFGDEGAPVTTHTVTVQLTHGDANRVFNAFAEDMNDNRSPTVSVLVGEASRICG